MIQRGGDDGSKSEFKSKGPTCVYLSLSTMGINTCANRENYRNFIYAIFGQKTEILWIRGSTRFRAVMFVKAHIRLSDVRYACTVMYEKRIFCPYKGHVLGR